MEQSSEILVYSQVVVIQFLFFDLTYTIYWCKIFKWGMWLQSCSTCFASKLNSGGRYAHTPPNLIRVSRRF